MLSVDPDGDRQRARNICGMMMFEQDMALKKVKVLSGGEKKSGDVGEITGDPREFIVIGRTDKPFGYADL